MGKRNAQVWGKWEQGGGRPGWQTTVYMARSHRCPRGGGAGLRALEWSQPGPWGPGDEPAGLAPGVQRAQGQAAWGRLSPARQCRGESSSAPWGREPLFRVLITRERFPRAFRGALGREASALEGAAT